MYLITADDGTFDSGILDTGQVFTHTYAAPGIYAFNCKLHGAPGGIGCGGGGGGAGVTGGAGASGGDGLVLIWSW